MLHPRQKLLRGYVCQLGQELGTKVKSTSSSPAGQKVKGCKAVKIHLGSPTPVWNLSETLRLISLIYEETRSFCKMQTFLRENTSLTSNGEDWKLEKNQVLKISFSNQNPAIV